MGQYINKSDIIAEIKRRLWLLVPKVTFYQQRAELEKLLSYIDTLEVKEVDFEKEVIDWWNAHYSSKAYTFEGYRGHYLENSTVINIVKHFFELGLKYRKENNNGL